MDTLKQRKMDDDFIDQWSPLEEVENPPLTNLCYLGKPTSGHRCRAKTIVTSNGFLSQQQPTFFWRYLENGRWYKSTKVEKQRNGPETSVKCANKMSKQQRRLITCAGSANCCTPAATVAAVTHLTSKQTDTNQPLLFKLSPSASSSSHHHSSASFPASSPLTKFFSQLLFINTVLLAVVIHASHQFLLMPSRDHQGSLQTSQVVASSPQQFGSSRYFYPRTVLRNKPLSSEEMASRSRSATLHHRDGIITSRSSPVTVLQDEEQVGNQHRNASVAIKPTKNYHRLISIQSQLDELRRQLEVASEQCQMTLGSPCSQTKDCSKSIENSHCKVDNFTCACLPYHVEFNSTKCVPAALLGQECLIDAQCQRKVQDSYCAAGICTCHSEFVSYRKDKCLPASKINDFCLTNSQCQLADKHSLCKWKIPHVYGHCKCPPNYKLIGEARDSANGGIKCAPRLGDTCLNTSECLLATANSTCRESTPADQLVRHHSSGQKSTWLSSSASSRKCLCADGYLESANKLYCLLDESTTPSLLSLAGGSPSLDAKRHHYDFVIPALGGGSGEITTSNYASDEFELGLSSSAASTISRFAPPTDSAISSVSVPTAPQPVSTSQSKPSLVSTTPLTSKSGVITPEPEPELELEREPLRASSLGKSCRSRRECQSRDPYSDCIGGICECLAPSQSCSANSTGCHRDTFQCRNGQFCISWYFVCDGFKNCDDGSDEDECQRDRCPKEAFQCEHDGACLPRSKLCDGIVHCPDGSDEQRCSPSPSSLNKQQSACHPRAFTCANGQCLPAYVLCNSVVDCSDGSDEDWRLCDRLWPHSSRPIGGNGTASRTKPTISAGSQVNVPLLEEEQSQLLSQVHQSQLGKTETSARANNSSAHLPDSPLVKADRLAMDQMLAALNLLPRRRVEPPGSSGGNAAQPSSAARGSRSMKVEGFSHRNLERLRARDSNVSAWRRRQQYSLTNPPSVLNECPKNAFTCRNGKCRSSAILCSGIDGCGDNSDENRCQVCRCRKPPLARPAGLSASG